MHSRRSFLAAAGAACTLASPAPPATVPSGPRMRLGCVSWAFRGIGEGPPWNDAIRTIGDLGFSGIELIVARAEELETSWNEPALAGIRGLLDRAGLTCSQFVLFQNAVAGLGSRKNDEKRTALRTFQGGCGVAKALGARIINIVAPWPADITGPHAYLPRHYAIPEGENAPPPAQKFHLTVPPSFPAGQAWEEFVAVMREATAMAKEHGLRFTLENHTHTFVPTTDGFLRLRDRIDDPALGMNLDVGWVWINREYPPLAIYKVKDSLLNVHIRDVDGLASRFPALGTGRMDLAAVVQALRDVGYGGYLTIEQDPVPDQRIAVANGRKLLEKLLADTNG